VVAVRADCDGRQTRRATAPPPRAAPGLAARPRRQWRPSRGRQGAPGWRRTQCVARRAWRRTAEGPARLGGGRGERAAREPPEERQDDWRNLPASAPVGELVAYAPRRHAREQFQEEAQGAVGGEQYQGRLWRGCHRHAGTGMRAYSFRRWQELRQRQHPPREGRPRAPCAPAAGALAACAAGRAAGRRPVAAPPSGALVGNHGSVHGTLLTPDLTK
jgi:hypothetical protein